MVVIIIVVLVTSSNNGSTSTSTSTCSSSPKGHCLRLDINSFLPWLPGHRSLVDVPTGMLNPWYTYPHMPAMFYQYHFALASRA